MLFETINTLKRASSLIVIFKRIFCQYKNTRYCVYFLNAHYILCKLMV